MIKFRQALCFIISVLMLHGVLVGCQRPGYVFQPVAKPQVFENAADTATFPLQVEPAAPAVVVMPAKPTPLAWAHKRKRNRQEVASNHSTPSIIPFFPKSNKYSPNIKDDTVKNAEPAPPERYRSRGVAFLLAILLGLYGAHRFYLGYTGHGIAYILAGVLAGALIVVGALISFFSASTGFIGFLVVGLLLLVALQGLLIADIVRILTGDLKPKNGEYYPRFFQSKPEPVKLNPESEVPSSK